MIRISQSVNQLSWLGIFAVVVLAAGCRFAPTWSGVGWTPPWCRSYVDIPMDPGPTYSKFISPHFSARLPHRVVMLESGFGQGNFGESRKMIEELAAQFRINGLFEVIVPTDVRLRSQADNLLEGKFDEREIAKIARQFSADAVVLVRVNQLQAHAPMRASLTMTMIDSHETIVTFAVDGNWDLADSNTNYQFTQYYGAEVNQMQGPGDLHFHSPNSLFRFAAAQIADEIRVSIR